MRDAPRERVRLSIGALPTAATELLPLAALAFRRDHPDIVLRVATGPNWMLLSQLREGAVDLVVGRMAEAETMQGLSFRQLYSDRVLPVVRPGHPLLAGWHPSALPDYPLMLPPPGAVIATLVRAWMHGVGLFHVRPTFENVSLAFGRRVVQESDTVWFISQGVVQAELSAGTLAALPLEDDLLGGPVGASMRSQSETRAELRAFLAALRQVAQSDAFGLARA